MKLNAIYLQRKERTETSNTPKEFEAGQLVLISLLSDQRHRLICSYKACPQWSLPYRILHADSPSTANAQYLISSSICRIHIMDCQLIVAPYNTEQQQKWEHYIQIELASFNEPDQVELLINRFFE